METNKITYKLIEQYVQGTLDEKAMHELERKALEDPFLADALEGYARAEAPVGVQLSLMQRQLEERIALQAEKKNVFYFTWQRISVAAAASLLFISASILFWMKANNNSHQVASNSPKKVEVTLMDLDSLAKLSKENKRLSLAQTVVDKKEIKGIIPGGNKVKSSVSPKGISHRASKVDGVILTSSNNVHLNSADVALKDSSALLVANNMKRSEAASVATINAKDLEELSAQHIDQALQGRMTFLSSSDSNRQVKGTLAKSSRVAALNEIRIRGTESLPAPANGWNEFFTYVKSNHRSVEPLAQAGVVILSFHIDSAGAPYAIKVKQGISEAYNNEAIRLLKEGPKWKAELKTDAEVIIPFEKNP